MNTAVKKSSFASSLKKKNDFNRFTEISDYCDFTNVPLLLFFTGREKPLGIKTEKNNVGTDVAILNGEGANQRKEVTDSWLFEKTPKPKVNATTEIVHLVCFRSSVEKYSVYERGGFILNEQAKKAYLEADKYILENNIKPLITKELIDEHRRKPVGRHSYNLMMVLNFLRRNHEIIEGKDLIVCTKPHQEWCLGEHPGKRGVPYKVFEDQSFDTREKAEHALFLKRLQKHGLLEHIN